MFAAPLLQPTLAAETRRILALAWPVMLTSLNWTILHVTDIVVVGLVSTEQVAALGASRTLTFIIIVAALGAMSGVLVFASRADGAGDLARTGRVLREGLVLGLGIGLGAWLLLFTLAPMLLAGVGVAHALVPDAARVVRVMAFGYPFQLLIVGASYFLEGISRPRRVMVVNLGVLPFNALLAWVLAAGHLGLPPMGAVGAALATVIASVVGAVAMLIAAWTLPRAGGRGVRDLGDWTGFARGVGALARFGAVPAIASALELAGFSILIALSTQLGDATAHAFQIVFSVHNVTFAVALGLGSAAGVRTGNAVGEGSPAAAIPRAAIAIGLTALSMGGLAVLLVMASPAIVAGFPATAEVHRLALAMLPVWAPFIVFDGLQVVLVYALRSLGDQVIAGANSIIAYFLVSGGLGWTLVHAGVGPMALVYASGAGMVASALLSGARFAWLSLRLRPKS
jgi:MATE family multidrug resistance protein